MQSEQKEKPSYSLLVSGWGWDQENLPYVTLEVKMGLGAVPAKGCQSSLGKWGGWWGGQTLPGYMAWPTQVI